MFAIQITNLSEIYFCFLIMQMEVSEDFQKSMYSESHNIIHIPSGTFCKKDSELLKEIKIHTFKEVFENDVEIKDLNLKNICIVDFYINKITHLSSLRDKIKCISARNFLKKIGKDIVLIKNID